MRVLFFTLALITTFSCAQAKKYPLSDHYDGERFFNPEKNSIKSLWAVLKWKFTGKPIDWPSSIPNKTYPMPKLLEDQHGIVTFINHSTFLIQLQGLTIMTDPIYSERSSPFTFIGPKRSRLPGVEFEEIPPVDVVIISHNHYDHLDVATLKRLDAKFHPMFLVPLGDKEWLMREGIQNVTEMDWWQDIKIKDTVITFTPSQHWSARGLFDRCESLWGSFMISSERIKIYFGGDTGYSSHFKQIKTRVGAPDLALLPIGAYMPRDFMEINHMNPEEAVKAHLDLEANMSLGMHFGTFQLTDEGVDDPQKDLEVAKKNHQVEKFKTLDQGESLVLNPNWLRP